MRFTCVVLLSLLLTTPATAWQAGSDGRLCTLAHSDPVAGDVLLTYDPSGPVYTITVTRAEPWPEAPAFGIAFQGGQEITITTDRQTYSGDRLSLSVTDRGFGNLLDGLSRNVSATVFSGPMALEFLLEGAAPEVEVFRACGVTPSV